MLKSKASLRINRRYILVEGNKKDVEDAILDYLGILGWAKAAPVIFSDNSKLIVAVNREEIVNVRAAFALSDKDIRVLRVSGTLKGLSTRLK